MTRLTKESISKNQEKLQNLNNEIYGKYNFKPEINKISAKIIEKKRGKSSEKEAPEVVSKPRWEELYSMVHLKKRLKNKFWKLLKSIKKRTKKMN